jgi:hypothetical protein
MVSEFSRDGIKFKYDRQSESLQVVAVYFTILPASRQRTIRCSARCPRLPPSAINSTILGTRVCRNFFLHHGIQLMSLELLQKTPRQCPPWNNRQKHLQIYEM